ncbi:hypothetical protein B9Z65_4818 [Elsinoe australis]|uniref:PD-(D/E)XK nuclease-like domain-containing protein n=1 Tax=Elsinoe australis TaxID=40998 RepID=A0A2P8A646_9PEZI|nr:hypothetical protein B9Z65_4818 [Elsinoe australis]
MATRRMTPPGTDSDDIEPTRGRTRKRRSSLLLQNDHGYCKAKVPRMEGNTGIKAAPTPQHTRIHNDFAFNTPQLSPSRSPTRSTRSRSNSPSKQQRILSNATPKTMWSTSRADVPDGSAFELHKTLIKASKKAFLPSSLRATLSAKDLADFSDPDEPFSLTLTDKDLPDVQTILQRAENCYKDGQDEAAWCRVVDQLLELALKSTVEPGTPAFEVIDTRTQAPSNVYLPYSSANLRGAHAPRVPSKKSDFSLAFHRHSQRVRQLANVANVPGTNDTLPLSHSSDQFTSSVPLQCAIEVKKEDGGHLEARSQLNTWHSAAMCYSRSLVPEAEGEPPLPAELIQIGWLVIGHKWEPCLSFVMPAGDHVTVGPIFVADMGTANLVSVYRLLAVLRTQVDWLLGTYWPAFEKVFSAAIARLHERPEE